MIRLLILFLLISSSAVGQINYYKKAWSDERLGKTRKEISEEYYYFKIVNDITDKGVPYVGFNSWEGSNYYFLRGDTCVVYSYMPYDDKEANLYAEKLNRDCVIRAESVWSYTRGKREIIVEFKVSEYGPYFVYYTPEVE